MAQLLPKDRVRIARVPSGAAVNLVMESFFRRFKTERRSLLLDTQILHLPEGMARERMPYYNGERRRSTIGFKAPNLYVATQWM